MKICQASSVDSARLYENTAFARVATCDIPNYTESRVNGEIYTTTLGQKARSFRLEECFVGPLMRSDFCVADGPSTNDTITLFFAVGNDTSLEGWRPDPFRIMKHCAQRYVSQPKQVVYILNCTLLFLACIEFTIYTCTVTAASPNSVKVT